jgi:PIN domain nuclease of toxin-antitoxin system
VIPARDFLASIERSAMLLLIALAALTLIIAGSAILSANRLVAVPLLRIAGQLKHIEDFRLDRVIRLASPSRELDNLSGVLLQMSRGLAISAVNFSEVLVKLASGGLTEAEADMAVAALDLQVIAFDGLQARSAVRLRPAVRHFGLSLTDRACLALGLRLGKPVVRADPARARRDIGPEIVLIRKVRARYQLP